MKKTINAAVSSMTKLNEVSIFRAMEKALNLRTNAIFCQETHGHAGFVEYVSPNSSVPVVKEISDLMIVSYNKRKNEIRLCFLQAKFHKRAIQPFLRFHGDFFQWELLQNRPTIKNTKHTSFPPNILSFTNYKSISSFGVFYYDFGSQLDMLFTIPDLLSPQTIKTNKSRPATTLNFPGHGKCPCSSCFTTLPNEIQTTCNLDMFMKMLLSGQVGAPINSDFQVQSFLRSMVNAVRKGQDFPLLDEIISSIEGYENTEFGGQIPNILFVKVGEEYENERNLTIGST